LGKFAFADGDKALLGEGTSSVCYLGSNILTGEAVAIKVYKPFRRVSTTFAKFKRQVSVLQEMQRPLEKPADEALWCEELASTDPASLFLKLLDFSKDASGEPALDAADGRMYIVTELAQCTLKDMLLQRNQRSAPLSAESVGKIAKEVVLAVAWLHAKGYVHLDIKPANIMMCGGRWKLIDMDGCARVDSDIKLADSTVSFSQCYCAPEFARGVVKGGSMKVKPSMDAWSVGMTIAELVNLCPLLRTKYQEISNGQCPIAGSISFLKWLGAVQAMPLPKRPVWSEDSLFKVMLCTWLLVPNPERRRTLAQSLNAPFFQRQDLD
jgi:serine/threonine protein kinase